MAVGWVVRCQSLPDKTLILLFGTLPGLPSSARRKLVGRVEHQHEWQMGAPGEPL